MTYAAYLAIFLGVPLAALAILTWRDTQSRQVQALLRPSAGAMLWPALLAHVVVAVLWTTPWDNYLVATSVWWYEPERVLGLVLGWVPIEEYSFFVLQTVMTGLWLIWLLRRMPPAELSPNQGNHAIITGWRWRPWRPALLLAAGLGVLWLGAVALLPAGWAAGAYLGLELGWFLLPIIMQILIGGDILWRNRRLLALSLLPPIIYLCATDALAIASGVWIISPQQTLGVLLGGVLPLEEVIFFTLTNTLIVFGMILVITIGSTWLDERQYAAAPDDDNQVLT